MRHSHFILLVVATAFVGCRRVSPTARALAQAGFTPANVTAVTVVSTADVSGSQARDVGPEQLAALWHCFETAKPISERHLVVASKYHLTLRTNAPGAGVTLSIYVDADGGACLEGGPLPRKHFFKSPALYDWLFKVGKRAPPQLIVIRH